MSSQRHREEMQAAPMLPLNIEEPVYDEDDIEVEYPPVIDRIDQADGYLIIHGRSFQDGDLVYIDGFPVENTEFMSTIRLTIPQPAAGMYDITVEGIDRFSVKFMVVVS